MIRRLLLDWRFYIAVSIAAVAVSWFWGQYAAAGLSLGLVGTFASVLGTWAAVKLMTDTEKTSTGLSPKKLLFGFILLSKLPVFFGCIMVASRLPDPGLAAFGVGVLLVYSGLVGWAQAKA